MLWQVFTIAWEAAAPPAGAMVVAVALYHATPRARDHLVLFFVLATGKLYTLGLMRTLNARAQLRARMKSYDLGRTSLGDWQWTAATAAGGGMAGGAAAVVNDVRLPASPTRAGRSGDAAV